MKYMLIMRATDEAFAAMVDVDMNEMLETVGRFNDELIRAGVLVAAEGLDDAAEGVVVDYSAEPPVVTDGPYGETKELFGGFYLLDVASKEEAVEWAKRLPVGGRASRPRSAGSRRSTSSRRTTSGSRRSGRGARPPASSEPGPTAMADPTGREAVDAVWRIESARIVGALARYTGDFALAEDVAQEALAEALVTWPRDGVPANPAGWLLTVGRRRAIDAFRRRSALDERYAALARDLGEGGAVSGSAPADPARGADDVLWDPDRIDDDVLALMFVSCHPVLSREARVALTLRVVGGLTSDEIARAFLVPTATVQARITRAKKTIAAARVPFEVPPAEERAERLGSVLSVLYLIFTEGSSATLRRRS